jgi:ornithine cyclodeaminase
LSLRILSAGQIRRLLPMIDCIDVMATAMVAASGGVTSIPPRLVSPLDDGSGALLAMPGGAATIAVYGAKLISVHPDNPRRGLPAIQGALMLFDHETGTPVALMDGAEVTGIRTAAASGLATRALARRDAASCGIFGAGLQAATHIDAMLAVRPVQRFLVWSRDGGRASAFAAFHTRRCGVPVEAVSDPAEAAACDIICTVTASPEPVLLGEWVSPGTHVNLVGAHSLSTREADTPLVVKSRLYVDLMESCRNEGGDFMIPLREGVITPDSIIGEIGQVLAGDAEGRRGDDDITIYKSHGVFVQDLYAARHVYDQAVREDIGLLVDLQGS